MPEEQLELFGEYDQKGKIRSLPKRTGFGSNIRKKPVQRRLAGKVDPRLSECKDVLRQAVECADHEALIWVLAACLWWLDLAECRRVGTEVLRVLDGELPEDMLEPF